LEFAQVFPVVNQRNIVIGGWRRLEEISRLGDMLAQQHFFDKMILDGREHVAPEIQVITI
jgi:hypothetical protein